MNLKEKFSELLPNRFFLDAEASILRDYLLQQNWMHVEERIRLVEKPGEGNMNLVLRVQTDKRSLILKQARPWVEKYPQFEAPVERIAVEAEFFKIVSKTEILSNYSPQILGFDAENGLLVLEDLGESTDYTFLYQKGAGIDESAVKDLAFYLSQLHAIDAAHFSFSDNMGMRHLNHEHIYNYPYLENNGLDLDTIQEGLQLAALPYQKDAELKNKIKTLGKLYLSKGPCLLHGDFYPGSWLNTNAGLKIIDPEFSFLGPPEFELGVLLAHFLMAEQEELILEAIFAHYQKPPHFDERLLYGFVGTELLRRLIGVAQLPLSLNLEEKKSLMSKAANWIIKV